MGRHDGRRPRGERWLGGEHRKRGCLGVVLLLAGVVSAVGLGVSALVALV